MFGTLGYSFSIVLNTWALFSKRFGQFVRQITAIQLNGYWIFPSSGGPFYSDLSKRALLYKDLREVLSSKKFFNWVVARFVYIQ